MIRRRRFGSMALRQQRLMAQIAAYRARQAATPSAVAAPEVRAYTGSTFRHDFGSLTEFCTVPFKTAENAARCAANLVTPEGRVTYETGSPKHWFGADTAEEAARRVPYGWPEGAARVLQELAKLEVPAPVSVRRRLQRAEQGDELDIHAVNRGDLDHAWTRRARRKHTGKLTVRLVVQTNLMAQVTAEELFWRGAAAVKFSDLLTEAGYNVEIIGALASTMVSGYLGAFMATFPLKAAQDPLDVEALTGVICNVGFHRVYGFRAYYALATAPHSCGLANSDLDGTVIKAAKLGSDGVRTFRAPYSVAGKASAEAWLQDSINELDQQTENA